MEKMSEEAIPKESIPNIGCTGGFLPASGLHKRHGKLFQEASYAIPVFAGMLLLAAAAFYLWLFQLQIDFSFKIVTMVILAGGGVCLGAVYNFINFFGQKVEIDPEQKTISIRRRHSNFPIPFAKVEIAAVNLLIPWSDVLGLQVCKSGKPLGFQLNIIWRGKDGKLNRHCLAMHEGQRYLKHLGAKYCETCSFKMLG
jgi:hypothetical protein